MPRRKSLLPRGIFDVDQGIDNVDWGIFDGDQGIDDVERGIDDVERGIDDVERGIDDVERGIFIVDQARSALQRAWETGLKRRKRKKLRRSLFARLRALLRSAPL
jgi:hypothetical protein